MRVQGHSMSEQRTERHVRMTCMSLRLSPHGDGEALWAPCIWGAGGQEKKQSSCEEWGGETARRVCAGSRSRKPRPPDPHCVCQALQGNRTNGMCTEIYIQRDLLQGLDSPYCGGWQVQACRVASSLETQSRADVAAPVQR